MNCQSSVRAIYAIVLLGIPAWLSENSAAVCALPAQSANSPGNTRIVVADRALTGPFSSAEQRGARMFLPAAAIAQALGDVLTVDPAARNVRAQRQTGVTADFNAQRNQILENGSIVMVVSDTADIVFPPRVDELMLPIEIMAPLLDVSIIVDQSSKIVRITRGQPGTDPVRAGAQQGSLELYQIDYSTNLNFYSNSFNHNVTLHTSGRIKDGRFDFVSNADGGTTQGPLVFRRNIFTFERENGQRLMGGDFGTGTDLEFLSTAIRGVSIQQPLEGFRLSIFGGRALSDVSVRASVVDPLTGLAQGAVEQPKPRYDTNVIGAFASFGPSVKQPTAPQFLVFSSGLMYFSGPISSGELVTASVKYNSRRNQFQGDVGLGDFSGVTPHNNEVHGVAPMIDLSELFSVTDAFTIRGRYTYIGANFLSPQSGGLFTPMNLASGGFNWRISKLLSASLSGSNRIQLGPPNPACNLPTSAVDTRQEDSSITASMSVTPRGMWPTMIFTHTQGRNNLTGANAYTLFNVTKEFDGWRLFGNLTRIQNGQFFNAGSTGPEAVIPPSVNVTVGAMVKLNDSNTLQASQSFGSGGSLGGAMDWMTSSFFTRRVMFGAGLGYAISGSRVSFTERALATIQLPFQQTLQLSYNNTPTGQQLVVQLRGALLKTRRAEAAQYAALSDIRSFGVLTGKVYQDINLNGQFDPGVDKPQEGVQVRVDGNYYEVTDHNGNFRVENVKAGTHLVYLDLLTVRADLTLLTSPQHAVVLNAGRDLIVDFRLVRTGRLNGIVWIDANGNGKFDDGEQVLSDVRVVTGSSRDTLTDAQGQFVLGDLPPGEHIVLIDEKTLPENMKSGLGSLRINVEAGGESRGVNFPIVPRPAEINIKRFSPNEQKPD